MKFLQRNKKSTHSAIDRHQALQCIPVVNNAVHISETESGEIMLEYPLLLKPLLQTLFERFQKEQVVPTKKLQLDEMGSLVWRQIDGKNTAQAIITHFASSYGITIQEAEKSVTTFLAQLGKRGIIAMR